MGVDERGRLAEEPFTHRVGKDGAVRISWRGRVVTTVAGSAGRRLAARLADQPSPEQAQLLLAKATGK